MEDGVWRTVGGRRIFIKEGQDLETAMKESGKFKNKKEKEKNDNKQKENNNEEKENKKYSKPGEEKEFLKNNQDVSYEKNIDTEEKKSLLHEYTAEDGYGSYDKVNSMLNGTKEYSDEAKKIINDKANKINELIKGELSEDITVYRGIGIKAEEIDVGDEIINKGFTSTAIAEHIAQDFANHYQGEVLEINVSKGTKALYVGDKTGIRIGNEDVNETELLFGLNKKIIITGKEKILDENGEFKRWKIKAKMQ